MIIIKGYIQKGLGVATKTIAAQRPFFKAKLTEIKDCHNGTINLSLEKPLIIKNPDYYFSNIKWGFYAEDFSFLKIKLQIDTHFNETYNCLIYEAHNSPHYIDPWCVEILAPFIDLRNVEYYNIIIGKNNEIINGNIII